MVRAENGFYDLLLISRRPSAAFHPRIRVRI